MNKNQTEGVAKVVKGGIKEATSTIAGNKAGKLEGKIEKEVGKAQTKAGNAQQKARRSKGYNRSYPV